MLTRTISLACSLLLSCAAAAQGSYPEKPIRLVVGFTAGGPTDLPARFIADRLGSALGQPVVVENRPGASGQIATQDVLSKAKDGYNLLFCTHFESINLATHKDVGYKLSDLAPVSQVARYYYGVVAANEVPAKDWEGFVAYAKANPGKVNYAMLGRGSAQEILALELGKLTGIEMTGISYKGGADVLKDLLPGRVQLYVSPTLAVLPLAKSGKLKLLAVTSPERLVVAPETPTLAEKGLPFVRFGWLGICAPAGTPQPVISLLNRHIGAIVQSGEYRQMIEKAGSIPLSSTPAELGRILTETYEQTARISREFGLQF